MTKRELVWLFIRLAGVYFAYLALITLFTVITSGWSVIFAPPKLDVSEANGNRPAPTIPGIVQPVPFDPNNPAATPVPNTAQPEKPEDKIKREAVMKVVGGLIMALIYGGLGFYFLRDGRILFALLIREDEEKKKPSEPEVTTLNL